MKKNLLIVFIALSTLNAFSQFEKGNMMISLEGNYTKSITENGVTTNQNIVQGKYLNVGGSVGCFIADRFIIGIGLDYNRAKEERTNLLMTIPSYREEEYHNIYYQEEYTDIKSKALLPNIYLGYYYQIINKFYFNIRLKVNYGKIKSEYATTSAGYISQHDFEREIIYLSAYTSSASVAFFSAEILPELTYFISSRFGVNLGLGGISYSVIDGETSNPNWIINFNPASWKVGINIKI